MPLIKKTAHFNMRGKKNHLINIIYIKKNYLVKDRFLIPCDDDRKTQSRWATSLYLYFYKVAHRITISGRFFE